MTPASSFTHNISIFRFYALTPYPCYQFCLSFDIGAIYSLVLVLLFPGIDLIKLPLYDVDISFHTHVQYTPFFGVFIGHAKFLSPNPNISYFLRRQFLCEPQLLHQKAFYKKPHKAAAEEADPEESDTVQKSNSEKTELQEPTTEKPSAEQTTVKDKTSKHVTWGDGIIDMFGVLRELKSQKYDKWIMMDLWQIPDIYRAMIVGKRKLEAVMDELFGD